ncbi:hypothetical protein RHMOL_Rhmol03G0194800 [Rhododendron molle]|uniref:Uncharacterized protein n=1 Tax=Rhododendron molle TaxID=49168 RepID=A0ACC0PFZ1_RHOML|nr:hypothetical protein RHMOL_Rhmol03G0194800 [Rhododendron molle]
MEAGYTRAKPSVLSCHILTFLFTTIILLSILHNAPLVSAAHTKLVHGDSSHQNLKHATKAGTIPAKEKGPTSHTKSSWVKSPTTTRSEFLPPVTYTNFIKASCSATTYPPLCFQTLSPHASAIKTNPWRLSNDALTISIESALVASAFVSKLAQQRGLAHRDAMAIKDCMGNIAGSIGLLRQSREALRSVGRSDSIAFAMDSIKTWVSAAITDESSCTDEFSGGKVSEGVKREVRSGIARFAKTTSNALALINHLHY